MAKTYALVTGWVLIILGVLGFFMNPLLGLSFLPTMPVHNGIHLVSGIWGAWAGSSSERAAAVFSKLFGVIYTLVALIGFFGGAGLLASLGVEITPLYNVIHLVVGLGGLWAGFGV